MPYKFERQYKAPTVINFTLFEADGVNINATASSVVGDIVIMQDEGVSANSTNVLSAQAVGHSLSLTSAETCAHRVIIKIVDQDDTKEWLSEFIIVETYGNEKSQHNRRESGVILDTIIQSVSGNREFIVTDKPDDNNTLLNSVAMIIDDSGPVSPPDRSFRNVTSYTGATGRVELNIATDFTISAGDRVVFLPVADIDTREEIASAIWARVTGQGVPIDSYTSEGASACRANVSAGLSQYGAVDTDDLPTNFGSLSVSTSGTMVVGMNNDKTDYVLSSAGEAGVAAEVLTYNWSAIPDFSADRSTINALRFLRNRWEVSGNKVKIYKENDTTIAWEATAISVASANSIVEFDPD